MIGDSIPNMSIFLYFFFFNLLIFWLFSVFPKNKYVAVYVDQCDWKKKSLQEKMKNIGLKMGN